MSLTNMAAGRMAAGTLPLPDSGQLQPGDPLRRAPESRPRRRPGRKPSAEPSETYNVRWPLSVLVAVREEALQIGRDAGGEGLAPTIHALLIQLVREALATRAACREPAGTSSAEVGTCSN